VDNKAHPTAPLLSTLLGILRGRLVCLHLFLSGTSATEELKKSFHSNKAIALAFTFTVSEGTLNPFFSHSPEYAVSQASCHV
jgi:hypothetical protein